MRFTGRRARLRIWVAVLAAAMTVGVGVDAAQAAPSVTVRGIVLDGGSVVTAARVGFMGADGTVATEGRTDASGRFSLTVTAASRGVVYAGLRPTATSALFTAGGVRLVRAVIGRVRPTGVPAALAAPSEVTRASDLAAAGQVRFALQRAGRIAGADTRLAGRTDAATIERRDGSVVATAAADGNGAFHSGWLVPGTYSVVLQPAWPLLPSVLARVTVDAGASTTVPTSDFVRGAVLSGRVTSAGAPVAVPITVFGPDGSIVARTTSDSAGAYAVGRLDSGAYSVAYGARYASVGATPQTTPTALPRRETVGIDTGRHDVTHDVVLAPAAQLTGRATNLQGGSVAVVAERQDGTVVAGTTAGASGTYSLGGLTPGVPLRLVAFTGGGDRQRYGTLDVTPRAGMQALAAIDAGATTPVLLSGTSAGAKSVTVAASPLVRGDATIRAGGYRIAVVPGTYTVTVSASGRVDRSAVVQVIGATRKSVRVGAEVARATLRLTSGSTLATPTTARIAAADGVPRVLSGPSGGTLTLHGKVPAGTYRFVAGAFAPPATDGPWWFVTPTNTVRLRAGATTALGAVPLRVTGG